nr:hypothetical protein [Companilactobacillus paralimentarius]
MAKSEIDKWTTPEGLIQLEGWARDGLTDEQIAHNIGISTSTLYNWKNKKLEIVESLKREKPLLIVKLRTPYSSVPRVYCH